MIKGSCLCGAIHYDVELVEGKVFNCHCQYCRKAHGADYVTVALADASTLTIKDEQHQLKEHQTGTGGFRAFCSTCGTRLFNYAPDKSLYFSVTLSTVDTPVNAKPVANFHIDSKASWCELNPNIPSYEGVPEGIIR
ncbi:GFA family protein [Vibrio gangliei]|uniref:GFA family protein n=1 Tax=Vibrio gangliei TaxID=2077090 RepID=UPI000D0206C5|nr:GFA family protein [Vibrio gangliei]